MLKFDLERFFSLGYLIPIRQNVKNQESIVFFEMQISLLNAPLHTLMGPPPLRNLPPLFLPFKTRRLSFSNETTSSQVTQQYSISKKTANKFLIRTLEYSIALLSKRVVCQPKIGKAKEISV